MCLFLGRIWFYDYRDVFIGFFSVILASGIEETLGSICGMKVCEWEERSGVEE